MKSEKTDTRWRCSGEVQEDGTVHVWPNVDIKEHVLIGRLCWCDPEIIKVGDGSCAVVVSHRRSQ